MRTAQVATRGTVGVSASGGACRGFGIALCRGIVVKRMLCGSVQG